MAEAYKRPNEPIDRVLRRFKKAVKDEGILMEVKKREHYEKPSESKKKTQKAALKRIQQQQKADEW
ncbi:MAG: 30S ribosomal protein S21 [Candidatus Margulisbacteria bacterium GWF2_35_9]|nr:MAG: 30S ribosomal protein S21 [Candidatus Margulisbacteria bacterium GWF2_35_9]